MTADSGTTADRLLDAHVAHLLGELSGDRLLEVIERDLDEVLEIAGEIRLDDVLRPDDVSRVVRRAMEAAPPSTTVSTMLQTWTDTVLDGPPQPFAASDVAAREHVEALASELLALHPLVEEALDRVAEAPLLGTLASRFVTRIVVEVLEANRSVAGRIPGVGSMVSLGTNAATKVIGAADKPLQQLLGDSANKGAAFAVRRLNNAIMATLKDPQMRDAVMELWDQRADEPIEDIDGVVPRERVHRIVGIVQDMVIDGVPTAVVQRQVDALVAAFFEVYGEYPLTTLMDELGVTRDDVLAELRVVLPRAVDAARAEGRLEPAIRARLEPFYRSSEVAEILAG